MKKLSPNWLPLAQAALSARDRLRSDALAGLDAILRQVEDPAVHQQVERIRAAVVAAVNELRVALKGRRRT